MSEKTINFLSDVSASKMLNFFLNFIYLKFLPHSTSKTAPCWVGSWFSAINLLKADTGPQADSKVSNFCCDFKICGQIVRYEMQASDFTQFLLLNNNKRKQQKFQNFNHFPCDNVQ